MSSALQQAQHHLLAEALKDDGERDDALIQRLESIIPSLQDNAGEADLLPNMHATKLESLGPLLHSTRCPQQQPRQKSQQSQDDRSLMLKAQGSCILDAPQASLWSNQPLPLDTPTFKQL